MVSTLLAAGADASLQDVSLALSIFIELWLVDFVNIDVALFICVIAVLISLLRRAVA